MPRGHLVNRNGHFTYSTLKAQKKKLGPLKLQLHTDVSCCVVAQNRTWVLWKATGTLSHWAIAAAFREGDIMDNCGLHKNMHMWEFHTLKIKQSGHCLLWINILPKQVLKESKLRNFSAKGLESYCQHSACSLECSAITLWKPAL